MATSSTLGNQQSIGPYANRLDRVRWPGSRAAIVRVENRMLASARKEIKAIEEYIDFSMKRAADHWRSSSRVDDIKLVQQAQQTITRL